MVISLVDLHSLILSSSYYSIFGGVVLVDSGGEGECTTPDLHITAGIITAGFVRTSSDVPSLSVMSLKMKK